MSERLFLIKRMFFEGDKFPHSMFSASDETTNTIIVACQTVIALSCLWIAARLLVTVRRRSKKDSNRIFIVLAVFIGLRGLAPLAAFVMVYYGFNLLFVAMLVLIAVSSVGGVWETERLAPEIENMPDVADIREARDYYIRLKNELLVKAEREALVDADREKLDAAANRVYELLESASVQAILGGEAVHRSAV